MKYERTGVILCTEKYDECVAFYSEVLNLPIIETLDDEHSKLTVLRFGEDTYLMVETGGKAIPSGKDLGQNPVWLRFNVKSVEDASNARRRRRPTTTAGPQSHRGDVPLLRPPGAEVQVGLHPVRPR